MSVGSGSVRRGRHRPWYRKITRSQVGTACLGVAFLLALLFAFQALRASSALRLAGNQAQVLQDQIVAGDDTSAAVTLRGLQASAHRAKSNTDGPLWDIGSKVPYFGKNVSAVQTVSEVIDNIATDALPPVVALSKQINLSTFSPHNGKVDLPAIAKIAPSVATASKALDAAEQRLKGINASSLLVPLRDPVSAIQFKIGSAQSAADSSNLAAKLLPQMLGGQGTRHYLLLIQNNAEVRATGGISGSFAILKAKQGRLSMGFQGSIQDLKPFVNPVVKMTADEASVFPPTLVLDLRDANATPDFARTGQITAAMVKKGLGQSVDGVISVDPIAMSYLLSGTGPVTAGPGVVIDDSNAVPVLLNSVYQAFQNATQQDDVFKAAARNIFNVVKSGRGEPRLIISGMVKAANENRLMIWSAHPDEQDQIASSGVSGVMSKDGGATPHIGMYLGDAASTKMEYYLDYSTQVNAGRCLPGKTQEFSTTTQLTSTAPSNVANLSPYITGDGTFTPRGTMRLIARFYAPYHGGITDVRLDGKRQTVYADTLDGRDVTKVFLVIKPGQTRTITTSMISGKGQDKDAIFSTTPGVQPTLNDVSVPSACG
ncbi:MAG: hypothetical protein JWP55_847 [Mycobacterium sp.]|nr:hypothetical protein [Mycobacterium sp.]